MERKIAPSILSADFSKLGEEIKKVENYVERLHIDVMDGHFVPNISIGIPVVKSIRKITKLKFDVHLMISNPLKYVAPFVNAGSNSIVFHIESINKNNVNEIIKIIKNFKNEVGIALSPKTSLSEILNLTPSVDYILLMSVEPGFCGQKFMFEVIPKIIELKNFIVNNNLTTKIQVDGGIKKENVRLVLNAGADVIVSGSGIFSGDAKENVIKMIKEINKDGN